jgi:hypothetical protein
MIKELRPPRNPRRLAQPNLRFRCFRDIGTEHQKDRDMTPRVLARCIRRLVIAGAIAGTGGFAITATSPVSAQMTTGTDAYGATGQDRYATPPRDTRWPAPSAVFQPPH